MSTQYLYKAPSTQSLPTMAGLGHLPPGHGYIPTRVKPDKPYGPSFVTVLNRMWRGPGQKYINYALMCLGMALLFFLGGALYFGHRNVGRMKVMNTEVLGALMVVGGILFVGAFFQLIYQANVVSNDWRTDVRFHAEGLCTAAAYNQAYDPDDEIILQSGTYGPMAIKEIPRPARAQRSRGRSGMLRSGAQTPMSSYGGPAGVSAPVRAGGVYEDVDNYGGYDETDLRAHRMEVPPAWGQPASSVQAQAGSSRGYAGVPLHSDSTPEKVRPESYEPDVSVSSSQVFPKGTFQGPPSYSHISTEELAPTRYPQQVSVSQRDTPQTPGQFERPPPPAPVFRTPIQQQLPPVQRQPVSSSKK